MADLLKSDSPHEPPAERVHTGTILKLAIGLIVLALAGFYLFRGPGRVSPATAHLPYGENEQVYASKVQIENTSLSRAENFLHQEVTTLSGEITNQGGSRIQGLELTVVFYDDLHQVVLRETRSVLERNAQPVAPQEKRSFEISFDHIPSSWNMRPPEIHITGLQL